MHNNRTPKFSLKALFVAGILLPFSVMAAGTALIKTDEDVAKISWKDAETALLQQEGEDDSIIIRDSKAYMITHQGGKPMVMDLSEMTELLMAFVDDETIQAEIPTGIEKIKATGESKTIAGVKGDVYEATIKTANGETEDVTLVLTNDKTVAELTEVYTYVLTTLLKFDGIEQVLADLPKDHKGVLALDDTYVIQEIDGATPKDDLFELPAKPVGLQDMLQDLQGLFDD